MKKRIASGYGITLFEIVIVIGFFAVFSAVFVRLFLSAHSNAARRRARPRMWSSVPTQAAAT